MNDRLSANVDLSTPEDAYPLTPMQHGMLVHSLAAPHSGIYVQQFVGHFRVAWDVSRFDEAWRQTITRHSILRTSFNWQDGDSPFQEVHSTAAHQCVEHDWRDRSEQQQKVLFDEHLLADRLRGFELNRVPLMRHAIFRCSDHRFLWLWTSHHAILDGRSRLLLIKEVFTRYEDLRDGRQSRYAKAAPFRDYFDWLGVRERALAGPHWKEDLAGLTEATSLGIAKAVSASAPAPMHGERTLHLTETGTQRLREVALREDVTPNTIFLGAWAILLSRYSGERDVLFGAARAGRHSDLAEASAMVGLFIHTLPIRVTFAPEQSVRDLLQVMRSRWATLRDVEQTPLIDIHRQSQIPLDQPLFESVLSFENHEVSATLQAQLGEQFRADWQLIGSTNYPIVLAGALGDTLRLTVSYDRGRFVDSDIDCLLGCFATVIERMVDDVAQGIDQVLLQSDAERQGFIESWNSSAPAPIAKATIARLIQQQIERTPLAVSVEIGDQTLTYRELERQAGLLVRKLSQRDVGPGSLVGLCVDRSLDLVIGLLGILQSGAAAVPLDPAYPHDRLLWMAKDADLRLIVTQPHVGVPFETSGFAVLRTGQEGAPTGTYDYSAAPMPACPASFDDPACVLYTSGSTGRPKGVVIEHEALARHCSSIAEHYGLCPTDRVLQFSSIGFDFALEQILAPLISGGTVVLREATIWHPQDALSCLADRRVTVASFSTSYWRLVIQAIRHAGDAEEGSLPRLVIAAGEAMYPEDLAVWQRGPLRTTRLLNAYGPTETTVIATTYEPRLPVDLSRLPPIVPIGRPPAHRKAVVLDHSGNPLPHGVVGELYLGGQCLARGYLNQPTLTAEKFLTDSFSEDPAARLYRTGDFVRVLPDGDIEFIGRRDKQIKLRGYRVELGEIIATLRRHDAIRDATVVVRAVDGSHTDKRLAAYVILEKRSGSQVDSGDLGELRSFLKTALPDYMIPATITVVDALTLNLNGKIDEHALPAAVESRLAAVPHGTVPLHPTEAIVQKVWSELLGVEQIGIHEDFFDLGGHSLLLMQVASRLRLALQKDIPLACFFGSRTIRALGRAIDECLPLWHHASRSPTDGLSVRRTVPLSFAQQRMWVIDQLQPQDCVYNIAVATHLHGPLHLRALDRSLEEIVRRHEILRTGIEKRDGTPVLLVHTTVEAFIPLVSLVDVPEHQRQAQIQRLLEEQARRPFDLSRPPLLRMSLIRLGEDEHILSATIHHIVTDAWSQAIFFNELSSLYGAFVAAMPSPLPALSLQYSDFAAWQRDWMQGALLEGQLDFWRKQLVNAPGLNLPADLPSPAVQTFRGAKQRFIVSPELFGALRLLCRREGVTMFMTLLAAVYVLLHRSSGQSDITIGTPISSRPRPDLEGLIGLFLNTLVLRVDCSGRPTFRSFLNRVKDVAVQAYAHQDVPFEALVERLNEVRDPSTSPFFQVLVVYQGKEQRALTLPGLDSRTIEVETATAKFALTVFLRDLDEGLSGQIEYNSDLFVPETVQRMAGQLCALLEGIVRDPEQEIGDLPILSDADRRRLLIDLNRTRTNFASGRSVQQLFEQQVEATPDATAIELDLDKVTFRELNARANRLAHRLRDQGAGAEQIVAICMERSIDMIVAVLGIVKSGAAYLPLDPGYPCERLDFMLDDAQVSMVVARSNTLTWPKRIIVSPDGESTQSDAHDEQNPNPLTKPGNAVYVIYTSGSTGKPKGVVLEHGPFHNLICWQIEQFAGLRPARTLQFTSLSFDVSAQEIFSTLCSGGTLVLALDEVRRDPAALLRFLSDRAVARLFLPFVALQQLAGAARSAAGLPRDLREIITAGEQVQATPHLAALLERMPDCRLVNQYGPTETHVIATSCVLSGRPLEALPPIGKPIANAHAYVLDEDTAPVPVGIVGELFIGGAIVGRGYLNRAALTADRFIPDPFSESPGSRLYRTGDRARFRADGNIEFLGRLDHQVKIRGHRIELGEIEAAMHRLAGVRQCAAVVDQSPADGDSLIAYLVADPEQISSQRDLRRRLKETLPEYMVPSAFVFLDSLPLTSTGKVDRKALPLPPPAEMGHADSDSLLPENPLEERVAGLWADVLQVPRVDPTDSFFDLGGHSLRAVQLAFRLSTLLKRDVSVKMLFLHPTVRTLIEALGHADPPQESNRAELTHGPAPLLGKPLKTSSRPAEFITFERQALLPLFATGRIPAVDAVALGYLSDDLPQRSGLSREEILEDWYDDVPTVDRIHDTTLGRVAIVVLPHFRTELYDDPDALIRSIDEATRIARQIGARTVSLTGLLPSATDYGRAIPDPTGERKNGAQGDRPIITTGHATTASSVVLAVSRILQEAGRGLAQETMAILGVGSIGLAALRLILRSLPHPRRIVICDVFSKRHWLDQVARELAEVLDFKGIVEVAQAGRLLPDAVYSASLIVGATSVPDVIDIDAIKPGTLIVDDSAPHCFALSKAIRRFESAHDLLFTEGGVLHLPTPSRLLKHLPRRIETRLNAGFLEALSAPDPSLIGSCVLSSLLTTGHGGLDATLGMPEDAACLAHYRGLQQSGCSASDLHCDGYTLPESGIALFRARFGRR